MLTENQNMNDGLSNADLSTKHLFGREIKHVYGPGKNIEFDPATSSHLKRCLRCRILQISIRDEIELNSRFVDSMALAPVKLSKIRKIIHDEVKGRHGEERANEHPVLNHASKDALVTRIKYVQPRLSAAIMAKVAIDNSFNEEGRLLVKSGEFHAEVYSILHKQYYFEQIRKQGRNNLGIDIIGGPKISIMNKSVLETDDMGEMNYIFGFVGKNPENAKIYIKDERREDYHSMVHSVSNMIAVCDDYHDSLGERSTTIVYNDPEFCEYLRSDFEKTRNTKNEIIEWDGKYDTIKERLEKLRDL